MSRAEWEEIKADAPFGHRGMLETAVYNAHGVSIDAFPTAERDAAFIRAVAADTRSDDERCAAYVSEFEQLTGNVG